MNDLELDSEFLIRELTEEEILSISGAVVLDRGCIQATSSVQSALCVGN